MRLPLWLLEGIDGRSKLGRRFRDVFDRLLTEFGITGEADMSIARQAAHLIIYLEAEAAKTTRDPADMESTSPLPTRCGDS